MNNFRRHLLWIGLFAISGTMPVIGNAAATNAAEKHAKKHKHCKKKHHKSSCSSSADSHHRWQFFGPSEALYPPQTTNPRQTNGRLTALATSTSCNNSHCRLWVGSAGGGLWRTDNALETTGPTWTYLGHHFDSPAIGTITVDPNDSTGNTVWVGTGETNFNATSIAGSGLYVTRDGGSHFHKISTFIEDQ